MRSNRISNWNSLVLENVRSSNIETINFVLIFIPNIDPETFSLNLFSNRSRKTKKNESDGINFERDFNMYGTNVRFGDIFYQNDYYQCQFIVPKINRQGSTRYININNNLISGQREAYEIK